MLRKVNKGERELKELQNLFADPKYMREVWRNVGTAMLQNPACRPAQSFDKNGAETADSLLQSYCYDALKSDLRALTREDREPTQLEMILACQSVRARYDTSAAVFIRDTVGAKPVDESKVESRTTSVYESLSDEELELLAAHRAAAAIAGTPATPAPALAGVSAPLAGGER